MRENIFEMKKFERTRSKNTILKNTDHLKLHGIILATGNRGWLQLQNLIKVFLQLRSRKNEMLAFIMGTKILHSILGHELSRDQRQS